MQLKFKQLQIQMEKYIILGGTLIGFCLFKSYFGSPINKYFPDISQKIIVITGANSGLGYQTCLEMAKMKPKKIILACRDQDKAEQAISQIKQSTGYEDLLFVPLDLSDLISVKSCAKIINAQFDKCDILINNAAVMALPKRQKTAQGFEMQLGTNHLGHFLLTKLLMPLLDKAKQARIINVTSLAYERGFIKFGDIDMQKSYNPWEAYRQSKLANMYFTIKLAEIFENQQNDVKVVALEPGSCRTSLGRHLFKNLFFYLFTVLIGSPFLFLMTKSAWQGAQTYLHVSFCPFEDLQNGGLYSDCSLIPKNLPKNHEQEINQFWDLSKIWIRDFDKSIF